MNNKINFTVFFNSRGRVPQLASCINALEKKSNDCNKIQLLITADDDDKETINFITNLHTPLQFNYIISPRPFNLNSSINNMALQARGQYVFHINDDAEMQTNDWDLIVLDKIKKFKIDNSILDDIIYGLVEDTSVDKDTGREYASFPIISKQAVETIQMYMSDQFLSHGADPHVYRIYKEISRVVDIKEVVLDHVYHNTLDKVMNPDQTNIDVRTRARHKYINPWELDISQEVAKLKDFINLHD